MTAVVPIVECVRLNPRERRSGHRRNCGSDLSADDGVLEERRDGSQHIHAAVMELRQEAYLLKFLVFHDFLETEGFVLSPLEV